jgi:hypothetical protein
MSLLTSHLDKIETKLLIAIEGRLASLFPTKKLREKFIQSLLHSLKSGILFLDDGRVIAPDSYIVMISKDLIENLAGDNKLIQELAENIKEIGERSGMIFTQEPQVKVSVNSSLVNETIEVIARINFIKLNETEEISNIYDGRSKNLPSNSFLIVNGSMIFPLDQSLINIGRSVDNDLVITDQRISRIHAQLRAIRGKYVISDLDSKGGTFVNGQRIDQQTLIPNDVISLAGVPIIYSQDNITTYSTEERK